jgi:peptidyl-tRNA hydrolase, PTH1 family
MKLIFAQGNPGPQYERSRHNTGFMALDAFAAGQGASWKTVDKFTASLVEMTQDGEKVLLVKPLSFYNDTGLVARKLVDFYKLTPSSDVLVVHDDLALPLGTIRVRRKGSDAGNNGIKSLNAHIGEDYLRIRIGIWSELRDKIDDADFVLSAFTKEEWDKLQSAVFPEVSRLLGQFLSGDIESTSTSL